MGTEDSFPEMKRQRSSKRKDAGLPISEFRRIWNKGVKNNTQNVIINMNGCEIEKFVVRPGLLTDGWLR